MYQETKMASKVKQMFPFMHNWLHVLLNIVNGLNYFIQVFNQMEALCTRGLITFHMGVWACWVLFVWLQIPCRQAMNDSRNSQCLKCMQLTAMRWSPADILVDI